jgi:hypothetical protein
VKHESGSPSAERAERAGCDEFNRMTRTAPKVLDCRRLPVRSRAYHAKQEQSVGMVRLTVEKFEAQSFGTTEISGLMVPQGTWQ